MPRRTPHFPVAALFATCLTGAALAADRPGDAGDAAADSLAHEIFKELIEINTTDSAGSVTAAAEAVAAHFHAAGFRAA